MHLEFLEQERVTQSPWLLKIIVLLQTLLVGMLSPTQRYNWGSHDLEKPDLYELIQLPFKAIQVSDHVPVLSQWIVWSTFFSQLNLIRISLLECVWTPDQFGFTLLHFLPLYCIPFQIWWLKLFLVLPAWMYHNFSKSITVLTAILPVSFLMIPNMDFVFFTAATHWADIFIDLFSMTQVYVFWIFIDN